jgi:purine-nucleoside phosphorylase
VTEEARQSIESRTALRPTAGVVLGSGLGAFADELSERTDIPYGEIPGWPGSTAVGHAGKLVIGKLGELAVAVMAGRAHLYEGYTAAQVTFGVRVLGRLGVRSIVFTNAAGGINLTLQQGGLVLISDHINLQGVNPLTGPNDDSLGPRFPDMSEAYSRAYREAAKQVAAELCVPISEGVYAAMLGPSYETPARSDRSQPHGNQSAGRFLRDQHGGRHSAAEDPSRGSARNRRAGARHAGALFEDAAAEVGSLKIEIYRRDAETRRRTRKELCVSASPR